MTVPTRVMPKASLCPSPSWRMVAWPSRHSQPPENEPESRKGSFSMETNLVLQPTCLFSGTESDGRGLKVEICPRFGKL